MKALQRFVLLSLFFLFTQVQSFAQCAMCNATAESSLDSGSTAAKGLNVGVLYLFLMPFLFASIFIFLYWKRKKELRKYSSEAE